jgi:hypothetical protein
MRPAFVLVIVCCFISLLSFFFFSVDLSLESDNDHQEDNSANDHREDNSGRGIESSLRFLESEILLPLNLPKPELPLIFFHLRKSGGTSIRRSLAEASKWHNITSWIPCFDNISCRLYLIPLQAIGSTKIELVGNITTSALYSIYGGHVYYDDVENVVSIKQGENYAEFSDSPSFNCLAMIRPTVDRVLSCWNYRMLQELKSGLPAAKMMTSEEWEKHLAHAYSMYGEGCNNEFLRIFGSISSEKTVNTLNRESPPCFLQAQIDMVSSRLSKCVILKLNHGQENKLILNHFIPWLSPFYEPSVVQNKGQFEPISMSNVSQSAKAAILKFNSLILTPSNQGH